MTPDDLRQPPPSDPVIRHILYPAIASVLFFAVATTPVDVLGCRIRGLIAFAIALLSVLAGVGAAVMALQSRLRGDRHSYWWVASALVLTIPAVGLLILA